MKFLILLIILLAVFFVLTSHFASKLDLPYVFPAKNIPPPSPVQAPPGASTSSINHPSPTFFGPTGEPHIIGPSGPPPSY